VDSYAASGLPAGLSVNPATGEISGTPTMAGTYAITLETTNVAGSRTATLTLSVLSPFAAWSELHGVLSADSDTDGDARSALMEYAMGSNPAVVDAEPPARVAMVDTGAIRKLEIEFVIPTERPGVRYGVEVSADLISWQQGHAYGTGVINGPGLPTTQQDYTALPDNGGTRVKVRTALPEDGASSRTFLRLRVELAAE
ncbi:MAG: Ig domain-containing protein, partial [Rariglobus sp.]